MGICLSCSEYDGFDVNERFTGMSDLDIVITPGSPEDFQLSQLRKNIADATNLCAWNSLGQASILTCVKIYAFVKLALGSTLMIIECNKIDNPELMNDIKVIRRILGCIIKTLQPDNGCGIEHLDRKGLARVQSMLTAASFILSGNGTIKRLF